MRQSIGRIVHYTDGLGDVFPAIVVKVHSDECVDLEVFGRPALGVKYPTSVLRGAATPHTWAWPPRV